MNAAEEPWDRFRIRAAVSRRGSTLTDVARGAGLAESACRMALTGGSRRGAEALSAFLGVPLTTLFPGLYLRARSTGGKASANPSRESRKKRLCTADSARSQS